MKNNETITYEQYSLNSTDKLTIDRLCDHQTQQDCIERLSDLIKEGIKKYLIKKDNKVSAKREKNIADIEKIYNVKNKYFMDMVVELRKYVLNNINTTLLPNGFSKSVLRKLMLTVLSEENIVKMILDIISHEKDMRLKSIYGKTNSEQELKTIFEKLLYDYRNMLYADIAAEMELKFQQQQQEIDKINALLQQKGIATHNTSHVNSSNAYSPSFFKSLTTAFGLFSNPVSANKTLNK